MQNENKYKFLVLLLSAKDCHLYLYDKVTFEKIKLSHTEAIEAYERDMPSKVGKFTDTSDHKEVVLDNYLRHIDHALNDVLNKYQGVPLFVLGAKKTTGHFNQITKHAKAVVKYIDGNYSESTMHELKLLLAPHILALDFVKEG